MLIYRIQTVVLQNQQILQKERKTQIKSIWKVVKKVSKSVYKQMNL